MKKILSIVLFSVMLVSCGGNAVPDDENKPKNEMGELAPTSSPAFTNDDGKQEIAPDMELFTQGNIQMAIPKGWKSMNFVFPDPPIDLVRAASQTVFFPEGQEPDESQQKAFWAGDFRYQDLTLSGKKYIVLLKGASTRYQWRGIEMASMTFYDSEVSGYKYAKFKNEGVERDACQAYIKPPGLKFPGEAFMWVVWGAGQPSANEKMMTQFYGIAVVGNSITKADVETVENIVKSLKF